MACTSLLTLFLLATVAKAETEILAKRIPQLSTRETYNGGWAIGLEGSTCPSDAPVACDTNGGYVNPTCCPKEQKCFGYASPYCCPSSTDCINVVTNFPVCASPTWSLYIYNPLRNLYFCCPPNQYGVLPVSGNAGICKPLDAVVPSSQIATPVASQAAATSGTKSTSTFTRTSTLVGGGVTVVTEEATVVAQPTSTATGESSVEEGSSSSSGSSSGSGSSSNSSGGKKKSKLSTGAIAGIAIAAVFLLLSTILGIWWRRRNNRKQVRAGQEVFVGGQGHPGGGLGAAPIYEGEYKSPAVSSVGYGGGNGVQQQQMAYSGTPTPPPPMGAGYGGPPVEAPAPLRPFGGRVEIGNGN